MKFGYFTLSDNHYENNNRNANSFVGDILDEAVYAEAVSPAPHSRQPAAACGTEFANGGKGGHGIARCH